MSTSEPGQKNRLAAATSPYLLQHAHNPVDWWPWGPEALAEAQRSNRPILLSIGYAACHWCHVMAHESFEDPATAAVMNELFVNIKVDREERPDIDQIYMSALHHLGEQGGWPLTMFLTPAGEPVWGGTYFPNVSRYGRPAFVDVLRSVAQLFRDEPGRIEQNRRALMARLADRARPQGKVVIGATELDAMANRIAGIFDPVHGGIRGAPKFPQPAILELLWRAAERTRQSRYVDIVTHTLEHMCEGGIYDHLGGGLSRYSVDERWLVPHFEKMLYDNAPFLEHLALAHARTQAPLFRQRAIETVGWLVREMTTEEGAFAASLDADSEGEEGKFYVWSLAELEAALGPDDAAFFAQHYDVTSGGNFEGQNILNRLSQLEDGGTLLRRSEGADSMLHPDRSIDSEARLAALRNKLLIVRNKRIRPGLDDKVLADWNGLMIAALANAGSLFGEPSWVALAERAFTFIASTMTKGDRLGHSWRKGALLFPGLASDFACMIKAALALHETTGEGAYRAQAVAWQRALDRHYRDPDSGGYFLTADDAEGLIVRPSTTVDDATPNPNAVTAHNLLRLAVLTGDDHWRAAADRLFDGLLPLAAQQFFAHATLFNALDLRLRGAEIVITGNDAQSQELTAAALKLPFLDRIIVRAPSAEALTPSHPAREKLAASSASAAFICVGERCSLPVTRGEDIPGRLQDMQA